ncbi:zinc-dependent alcohol dehydrogenase family protein [Nocardia nova]|uniref:zinc-dependent alcohol dehydrogenase family protein n=1 Tax=Nocardia nova TaxID=37330 RepID=UPI001E563824|nr:zinc-dependent alcohol dehydrogenase family protein [Nocardia nova]
MTTETMQAAVLQTFGSTPVLRTVPRPSPGPGRVLVGVAASAVNPLDVKISLGDAAHARVSVPATLGIDVAGVVADVGPGVRGFAAGDEVYGMTGGVGDEPGSLAEYIAADPALLAHKPRRLTMREAAALPLAAITAWEALVDRAAVAPGDLVLVHGGAGGVGHIAVQLAIARGATVYATGSGRGLELIRSLGATPIDYTTTTVEQYVQSATGGVGFDIVLDTLGGETLDASFVAVRRYTGRVVSILGWGSHSLAPLSFRGASYSGVFTLQPLLTGEGRAHHGEILTAVAELVDQGYITPSVDPTPYTLAEVAQAHRAVAEKTSRGKAVVTVRADRTG